LLAVQLTGQAEAGARADVGPEFSTLDLPSSRALRIVSSWPSASGRIQARRRSTGRSNFGTGDRQAGAGRAYAGQRASLSGLGLRPSPSSGGSIWFACLLC